MLAAPSFVTLWTSPDRLSFHWTNTHARQPKAQHCTRTAVLSLLNPHKLSDALLPPLGLLLIPPLNGKPCRLSL